MVTAASTVHQRLASYTRLSAMSSRVSSGTSTPPASDGCHRAVCQVAVCICRNNCWTTSELTWPWDHHSPTDQSHRGPRRDPRQRRPSPISHTRASRGGAFPPASMVQPHRRRAHRGALQEGMAERLDLTTIRPTDRAAHSCLQLGQVRNLPGQGSRATAQPVISWQQPPSKMPSNPVKPGQHQVRPSPSPRQPPAQGQRRHRPQARRQHPRRQYLLH
jgi:hypothetical protein